MPATTLDSVLDRLEAIQADDVAYTSFAGKSDSMNGNVKFIIETEPIELPEE